ncbi:MAG: sigma-54-dependent Fis family transcriptional regulator [Desulfobacterales bacterium]|nr:MAG: sigma-54-dependent Fis family transcriptional regulator [Desulfobacterales bacterium]
MYPKSANQTDQYKKIVILESNQNRRDYLRSIISGFGYTPFIFEKETICLDNLHSLEPDLVISGPSYPRRIFRFINTVKLRQFDLPVLVISSDPLIQDYAQLNGFADVSIIETNFEISQFRESIHRALKNKLIAGQGTKYPLIIGNSPEMVRIKKVISELQRFNEPVLVQGEIGTGKELVARAIHSQSERRHNPFVKVNLAELPLELLECDLFGCDQLTSTNKAQDGKSLIHFAQTGTLFLETIETIPAALQVKLLRFFEEGGIFQKETGVPEAHDISLVVSSRTSLDMLVHKGHFRKDLFYRLNVFRIEIPPLRHRIEDIPTLADFVADKFCMDLGKSHYEISDRTKDVFCSYAWPGNVRELEDLVRAMILQGDEDAILERLILNRKSQFQTTLDEDINMVVSPGDVKEYIRDLRSISLKHVCKEFLVRIEKRLMQKVLASTNWNRRKAAMILNISYKSLLNKIKAYELG